MTTEEMQKILKHERSMSEPYKAHLHRRLDKAVKNVERLIWARTAFHGRRLCYWANICLRIEEKLYPKFLEETGREYTSTDKDGIRWRWSGSRPVSEIADKVANEVGLEPLP